MNDTESIIALGKLASDQTRSVIRHEAGPFPRLIIPQGDTWKVVDLPGDLTTPHRLSGSVQLDTTQALIDYVKAYKGERIVAVYAHAESNSAVAVFDHHSATDTGWGAFRASLNYKLDPRFTKWAGLSGKWQEQSEFAEFLEDHSDNIAVPDAPTMIDIICDLKVNKGVNMQSTKTLRNGNLSIVWDETTTESREVPSVFTLKLPVYANSRVGFEVTARLRYRFHERQLRWQFVINNLDTLKREAWQREVSSLLHEPDFVPVWEGQAP